MLKGIVQEIIKIIITLRQLLLSSDIGRSHTTMLGKSVKFYIINELPTNN